MKKTKSLLLFIGCLILSNLPAEASKLSLTTQPSLNNFEEFCKPCSKRTKYCKGEVTYKDGSFYKGEFRYGEPHGNRPALQAGDWVEVVTSWKSKLLGTHIWGYQRASDSSNFVQLPRWPFSTQAVNVYLGLGDSLKPKTTWAIRKNGNDRAGDPLWSSYEPTKRG